MDRRTFIKNAGIAGAGLASGAFFSCGTRKPGGAYPNIIFIMADDMGYGDVGCYNPESRIPTPNMDRLAQEGIRFTDAHSPSAVCTPTRYGVLTGRYCWRTRLKREVFGGYDRPLIEPQRLTAGSLLQQKGYETACIGKWHLGLGWATKDGSEPGLEHEDKVDFNWPISGGPVELGFDYFFGTAACSTTDPPYVFIENDKALSIPNKIMPDWMEGDRGLMAADWKQEDVDPIYIEKSIGFIENHRKNHAGQPFFLSLPLSAPHAPWLPPDFVKGKSSAGPRGDQVVLVDWCVGQIVETLQRLNLTENTLLIVTSDNGPRIGTNGHKSSGNFRGYKSHIWEGGHRIPFIARWPGKIKAGIVSDEVICLADLMATAADIVDAELPDNAGEDSYNILPALLNQRYEAPIREAIVHHSVWGVFAIRQGAWKLILDTRGSGGWVEPRDDDPVPGAPGQLYNLDLDPGERNNLRDKYPEIVKRLRGLLEKYKREGRSRPVGL